MTRHAGLKGLYAITDSRLAARSGLAEQVAAALQGGAAIIQYRDKQHSPQRRLAEAARLRQLTREHRALLIVNDDVELALAAEADGIHLGRQDLDLDTARQLLGPQAIIGISCYNRLELALQAQQAGADYVAFGRFFPSKTKPDAIQADPALLREARRQLQLPLVAIGGITPENGRLLIDAGADMLAVIHAVFGQPDIGQTCARFQSIFQPEESSP
jgi:thiamine-phosphate pyrophosphorylase